MRVPRSPLVQLKKIKDLPRVMQRLRLTQGVLDIRDFQHMLERSNHAQLRYVFWNNTCSRPEPTVVPFTSIPRPPLWKGCHCLEIGLTCGFRALNTFLLLSEPQAVSSEMLLCLYLIKLWAAAIEQAVHQWCKSHIWHDWFWCLHINCGSGRLFSLIFS